MQLECGCTQMQIAKSVMAGSAFIVMTSAYAQVTVDIAKISCEQFLEYRVANPRDIAIWINGFYHGKKGSTIVHPQELRDNVEKLKDACYQSGNAKRPIVQVIEQILKTEE